MSGVLLVVVSSINAEYEWNGKEWIWKETPTVSISLTLNRKLQYKQISFHNNYLKVYAFIIIMIECRRGKWRLC